MSLWAVSFVLFAGLVLYCINRCREGTLVWSKETVGGGGVILVVTAFIVFALHFKSSGGSSAFAASPTAMRSTKRTRRSRPRRVRRSRPVGQKAPPSPPAPLPRHRRRRWRTRWKSRPTLSSMEVDILGPLSGVLMALPAVAPPPLNVFDAVCAWLSEGHAVLGRFNEAAVLLQRRAEGNRQKLQDVVQATQGLPTGQVEAAAGRATVHRPGA